MLERVFPREADRCVAPLERPGDFAVSAPGLHHEWRTLMTYPTVTGRREPEGNQAG